MAERNLAFEAAMIVNDLDSMNMRIEQLQAHPLYTEAQVAVQKAKECMNMGRALVHEREMKQRFAAKSA